MNQKICTKHSQPLTFLCLAEECKEDLFLCTFCKDSNLHKHSKTDLIELELIKRKLKDTWELKDSPIDPYFKKINLFYEQLRKEVTKLIDEDQKSVEIFLTKVKYHHLPYEVNSQAYLELIREDYDKLDKNAILKLVNQSESGELNKNLEKQQEIINFLELEVKKVNDKVLTLKYVLLSKKFEAQLLQPNLSEESKVAYPQEFVKIYSLFNSRKLLIRSAKLVYRSSENQFSAKSFYNQCNGLHNCLTILKTTNNKLVGGFTPLPLVYHDEDELDENDRFEGDRSKKSFIFSISNLRSFSVKDSSKAIRYRKNVCGPSFGVDLDVGKIVTSSLGHSYEGLEGGSVDSLESKVYLLEAEKSELKEMEIWQLSF